MQCKQTGINSIKIILENQVEEQTISDADSLEITIERTSTVGFRGS